ncbi:hypothetical protein LIER_08994 [Lithospermum erythrorhizon]|uniref:Increased DNA methylation 1 C-terminal domain-containing protein n=1 Tax=Lithospermum erythrorhizon TaxID=34254 RepID=A0AAV3PID9_LITER
MNSTIPQRVAIFCSTLIEYCSNIYTTTVNDNMVFNQQENKMSDFALNLHREMIELIPNHFEKTEQIFNHLKKFVGLKNEMEGGLSWSILHRCDVGDDASLSDYPLKLECNAKLAIVYSVMDECFFPVVDPRSQSEMISNVTYNCGSNIKRLNYSGFYTFILEKRDEVVSAASIRFHGTQLAEMPFIATRNFYRQQGMSRQLLNVIEKVLSLMDIHKMIIPAVSDVMTMWTNSFSFTPLEEATRQEMKAMSIIVFPGTDMLQKQLPTETGSESEPSVPEIKHVAGACPENKTIDTLVDWETTEISEQNREEDM